MNANLERLADFTVTVGREFFCWVQADAKLCDEICSESITVYETYDASIKGNFIAKIQIRNSKIFVIVGRRLVDPMTTNDRTYIANEP